MPRKNVAKRAPLRNIEVQLNTYNFLPRLKVFDRRLARCGMSGHGDCESGLFHGGEGFNDVRTCVHAAVEADGCDSRGPRICVAVCGVQASPLPPTMHNSTFVRVSSLGCAFGGIGSTRGLEAREAADENVVELATLAHDVIVRLCEVRLWLVGVREYGEIE